MGTVTHTYVSAVVDDEDPDEVGPDEWNATHTVPTNSIIKNNFSASTDPTSSDDSGDGYEVGSRWINTSSDIEYVCVDSTASAAVWTALESVSIPAELAAIRIYASQNFR